MQIKYIIISFLMVFLFVGCSENNTGAYNEKIEADINTTTNIDTTVSSEGNTSTSTVILSTTEKTISLNNEVVNIDVTVIDEKNNPFEGGNIKIVYPNDVRVGRDIGYFENSTVAVKNGKANFTYTAPDDININSTNIVFGFYHDSKPSEIKTYTIKLTPQEKQIILSSYKINNIFENNEAMGLESSKLLNFFVNNSKDVLVDDTKMQSFKISILNPTLGTLEDTLGNVGASLTIKDKNSVTVNIKSNKISGIIPIEVEAVFADENDDNQSLSKVYNIIVLSGPPSAMSLSYAGTTPAEERAKFVEKWILTVTDKYNNLVNTNPAVSIGMIVGYAKSSATTKPNSANYLYYPPSKGGTLNKTVFTAQDSVFGNVDQTNEVLVTFGNGYTYDASGKWDINTNTNTKTLDLVDNYDGSKTSNLGFAVGHNYRQDASLEGVEWVANAYPQSGNYIVDETGSMAVNIEYDYYLTGKDVVLWVNLVGMHNDTTVRIGEAKKITLRGNGISPDIESCNVPAGGTNNCKFCAIINDTIEYYRHARFSAIPISEYITTSIVSEAKITDNVSCITYSATNTDAENPQALGVEMLIINEF